MMESAPNDMDLWMATVLNRWAEQGDLPSEKSAQLHEIIADLSYQERKRRLTRTRTACGLAAAIMACIWLLFASCPVAAAAYLNSAACQPQFVLSPIAYLMVIIACYCLNHLFQLKNNKRFEVYYE